jgi:hypothetical protein
VQSAMKTASAAYALLVDPEVKQSRVRLLVTIVLVGMVTAIAAHFVATFYLDFGIPRATFLFKPSDYFNDWYNPYLYAKAFLHNGATDHSVYFPFAFFTVVAATIMPPQVGFDLLVVVFLGVVVLMLRGWVVDCEDDTLTKVQYAFVLSVLSYPVIFVIDRGNLEMLLFVFIALFFYFLYARRSPWLAALFLGAAIAFKLYPATLLLLLLAERRFKVLGLSIAMAFGLTALGAGASGVLGHHSFMEIVRMSTSDKAGYQQYFVYLDGGLQHGHTLWGLLRIPGFLHGTPVTVGDTRIYTGVAAIVFLALSTYVLFYERERWKRVLFSMVPAILLPFTSGDYTLIHMYFPLVFFLNAPRTSRWDSVYVILFALLLIPVDYHYFSVELDGVSVSVVIYPIIMIALMMLAIVDRQRSGQPGPETLVDAP